MLFFLLFVVYLMIVKATLYSHGAFNNDYLTKDNTKCMKGLFVVLIIFSHYAQYVVLDSVWDSPYLALRKHLDQMIVVPFLFYSGVGVMKSIQNRGEVYVKQIMSKRVPKVWFNFAIAILWFLVVNLALGQRFPLKRILLSFVGWSAIGNSNWYILGILVLYIFTYVAFKLTEKVPVVLGPKKNFWGCIMLSLFTIGLVAVFISIGRPNYCYNTLIIYVVGCWYVLFQSKIEALVMKNDFIYALSFLCVVIGYCYTYLKRWEWGIEGYSLYAIMFTALMVLITMKVRFQSEFLSWFGEHVFSIYILQRIPMIILKHVGFNESHKYMFLVLSWIFTIVLAMVFEKTNEKILTLLVYISKKLNIYDKLEGSRKDKRGL